MLFLSEAICEYGKSHGIQTKSRIFSPVIDGYEVK